MLCPAGAQAAETTSRSFIATGESLFIVPAGVTSLHVTLVGGAGGASLGGGPHGGSGALVSANLAVTPGESLFAEVGGYFEVTTPGPGVEATNGGGPGGGGYGGGGGGASDVRTCSSNPSSPLDPLACSGQSTLSSRLVVAGAGGGGGGNSDEPSILGGAGGNAGEAGHGGEAYAEFDHAGGDGGEQASASSGGAGGGGSDVQRIGAGTGLLGTGGNGGGLEAGNYAAAGGGGGGGGLYGGGGGGGGESSSGGSEFAGGGGGGGGSSGVPAGVSGVSALAVSVAPHSATPEVAFSWTQPAPSVSTGTASAISGTSATLNGTVNPNGSQVTDCHFQISPAPPSGGSAPCLQQIGAGSAAVSVSAATSGLSPTTAYTVTLEATSAQGSTSGSTTTFATSGAGTTAGAGTPGSTAGADTPGPTAATNPSATSTLTITNLRLSPARFRSGKTTKPKALPTATTISFTLSQAAAIALSFEQAHTGVLVGGKCVAISKSHGNGRSCIRYVRLSSRLILTGKAGTDRVRFDGILGAKRHLTAGRYRVSLTASSASGRATARQHPSFTLVG
jgi:hypothetical protein